MGCESDRPQRRVGRLVPGDPAFHSGLHEVLDARPSRLGRPDPRVRDLLAAASDGTIDLDSFYGVFDGDRLQGAALLLTAPGSAALAMVSTREAGSAVLAARRRAMEVCLSDARRRSIKLVQALAPDDGEGPTRLLESVGFERLTRLIYLTLHPPFREPGTISPPEISWTTYSNTSQGLFCEALALSYEASRDCPELSRLRDTSDVLLSHRARLRFDGDIWFVARVGGAVAGVLLLNRIGPPEGLEIVYLGVSQPWRGQGVADALLARCAAVARRESVMYVTLAVDERNDPARRMYARWGFRESLVRRALIYRPVN